jgi:AraC family transcriptional regulator, positive regulator of tynA and feaB
VSETVSTYSRGISHPRDEREIKTVLRDLGFGNVSHRWLETRDFRYAIFTCTLDGIAFVNSQTTASEVVKDSYADDVVTLTRVVGGGQRVSLPDGVTDIAAGETYTLSSDVAFDCSTLLWQDVSVIAIPRSRLRRLGLSERALAPKGEFAPPGSVSDVLFDFFHSFALRAHHGPDMSARAVASVHRSVESMVAATLEENDPTFPEAVKAYVGDHLQDPGLNATTIAAALHVSKRTLYRLFAENGDSLAAYIRRERLRRAKWELEARAAVSIREVALRWGFLNGGHFAKLFLEEFGSRPSDHRRR